MPGFGFLKKKRTRDGHSDNSAASPASPVTSFHQKSPSSGGGTTTASGTSDGASAGAGVGGQTAAAASRGAATATAATTGTGDLPPGVGQSDNPHAHNQSNHQPPPPAPGPTTSGAATASTTTTSPSGANPPLQDPQDPNGPGINNLAANAPQNDRAAQANANSSSQSNSNPSPSPFDNAATATASPGTDPVLLQQQQEAARAPLPAMTTMQTDQLQAQAQQPTQHGQQPVSQEQQVATQQTQSGHQQQASTSSVARVTKGKYSLTDFDMLRTLGTGSFGRVHLVQSKHNQRYYAIKVLKKAQIVKMKQVEHTNDERRMLSDVKHPFLITLWGTFQDWKNLYMVMDFVEGGELFSLLRKSGRFPNPVAKFYAAEVTLALEYMHSKNVIYRDLKPENLLLDRHGHLKITDFGFAKRVPDKTWTLCGTPDYLAPEVVSNKGYNKSVDWWSLGILIYEMLCGYTPFWDSGSPMRIYENILKGKIKYPAYIVPEAQDLLEKLITPDLTKRLGNLYGGSSDVKSHPWFHEVTWDRLARKDIDAPYTPPVKAGAGDASQFDKYPEEQEQYGQPGGADDFGHMFTGF